MFYQKLSFIRVLTTAFALLLPVISGWAQDRAPFILGGALQQGRILVHTPKIKHLAGTSPTGIELNVQQQTTGKQYWHQLYGYPRIGISFTYLAYHNLILGRSFALSPYLSLPIKRGEKSTLHFRFGAGLAYFTNHFDYQHNPTNNIISNHYNAVIQTRLEYTRKISPHISLVTAIGINHYSNGGDSKPNLGINIGTATLGLNYHHQPEYQTTTHAPMAMAQRNFVFISSSIGVKQRNDFDTAKYVVNAVAVGGLHRLNQKSSVLVALEGFYDPSQFPRRAWDPRVEPGTNPDIRRAALTGGYAFHLGKLALGAQAGWYFYRPYKSDAGVFQRLETKLQLHKNIFVAASLKLHDVIKADIIEYRLGLQI